MNTKTNFQPSDNPVYPPAQKMSSDNANNTRRNIAHWTNDSDDENSVQETCQEVSVQSGAGAASHEEQPCPSRPCRGSEQVDNGCPFKNQSINNFTHADLCCRCMPGWRQRNTWYKSNKDNKNKPTNAGSVDTEELTCKNKECKNPRHATFPFCRDCMSAHKKAKKALEKEATSAAPAPTPAPEQGAASAAPAPVQNRQEIDRLRAKIACHEAEIASLRAQIHLLEMN